MSDKVPRVSEVLAVLDPDAYAEVPAATLVRAAERGTALHRLCCQHLASLAGLCAEPVEVEAEHVAAYEGLLDWIRVRAVEPVAVEQEGGNVRHGYIGHPDLLCLYGQRQIETLIDLKFTAQILPLNRVQVRAYWELEGFTTARQAFLVHIDPRTGRWTEHRIHKTGPEWPAFLSALNVWRWRQAT